MEIETVFKRKETDKVGGIREVGRPRMSWRKNQNALYEMVKELIECF